MRLRERLSAARRRREPFPEGAARAVVYAGERPENAVLRHLEPAVAGPVNPARTEAPDPVANTQRVVETARFFEADLVGVVELRPDWARPGASLEGHRFAIALGTRLGRRAGEVEASVRDAELAMVACMLADYLRELGFAARAHHATSSLVRADAVAAAAGFPVGRLRLATVTTDLPLAATQA